MRKGRLPSFTARTVVSATLLLIVVTVLTPRERRVAAFPLPGPGAAHEWPTTDGVGGAHWSGLADITPANVASPRSRVDLSDRRR